MKVSFFIQKPSKTNFKGVREDRNTVAQLKQDNSYSLTEPNQRRINKAIESLAKQKGEENIKFLLDVGKNITYQTNIKTKNPTKNEWKTKLKNAANESLMHSDPILREKYEPEIERVFNNKQLNKDDKYLNLMKNRLMKRVEDGENKKDIDRNLSYFISSTETPIKQKRYILKRLNHFMSDDYKINPQLKDKKTEVLAEMINDITVNTPESKIPNIKAINQKTHGMCAAISITRKAIAYEDKPNYIDSIMSELDDSDKVMIYDREHLGSGKRIPVNKTYIDFDYAQKRGYRIVDASTLQWMNIAGMYGSQNESLQEFNAFDPKNFDAFHDSFFMTEMRDKSLAKKQAYFQTLTKAKDTLGSVKSSKIKKDLKISKNIQERHLIMDELSKNNSYIRDSIDDIAQNSPKISKQDMMNDLMRLSQPLSSDIEKLPENIRKYAFLPNEEKSQKIKKVEQYFLKNYENENINEHRLNQKSENIVDTLEDMHNLSNRLNNNISPSGKIANARKLYEAEGLYRTSYIIGLMEPETLTDFEIQYNIPDRETRISEGFSTVINKIEKKNDKKLINHFAKELGISPDNKKEILSNIKQSKDIVDMLKTDVMDDLYRRIGYKSRVDYILEDLADSKNSILQGDKQELLRASECMHVKNDKKSVLKEYEKLEAKLNKNPKDEKAYTETLNKLGYKDQTTLYINLFKEFTNQLSLENPNREILIEQFKKENGLNDDPTEVEILGAIQNISTDFNAVSKGISSAEKMLNIHNEDGSSYFTVTAPLLIIQKLEKNGTLVDEKTMKKLQDRFTQIDKIRSTDEFSSRQGKISKPELYKLSPEEKRAVKLIDKKLNMMYADVTRNLDAQYRELKEPLEKLANYVGTNEGNYWVSREGSSGLCPPQEVKIFEQITDRPYKAVSDIEEAVETIKNGPRSGVSCSSVFHDRLGGHAQYIADIKEGANGKDILFHDNSWGASEHENIWTDSEGLTRTDYSDRRGGELGYITNDNWLNGNYVENITHKKGHLADDTTESKIYKKLNPGSKFGRDFNLMHDIILEGEDPEYKTIAGGIKDAIFIPDSQYVGDLQKSAEKMTEVQIQKNIFKVQNAGLAYRTKYKKIMDRLDSTPFKKGIDSKEDYDKLSDTDIIKITFEKAALRNSYEDSEIIKELGKVNTLEELEKVKSLQREKAMKNFEYSFGKTGDYFINRGKYLSNDLGMTLLDAIKNNKMDVTQDELSNTLRNIVVPEKKDNFKNNYSVKNQIDFCMDKATKQFDENFPKGEKTQKIKEEYLTNLQKTLEEGIYFNKEDLKLEGEKAKGIRHWIDRKFEPQTDEEFIEIYRKLQDMPIDEFKEITKDVTDEELGIKDITGYDILTKVKAENDSAKNLLRNTLFYDEYIKDMDMSRTRPSYKYTKLERRNSGSYYKGTRTFDDLYRTMYFSLSSLEYKKAFDKHKDDAYRKYGAFPAYPKINLTKDPIIKDKIKSCLDIMDKVISTTDIQRNCLFDIRLIDELDKYRTSIPEGRKLTKMERDTINSMVGSFVTYNGNDPDMEETLESAYAIFDLGKDATIKDYNKHLDNISATINALKNLNKEETLKYVIKEENKELNNFYNELIEKNIPKRYRKIVKKDLINLTKLKTQNSCDNGFDENKDLIELLQKISDCSINPDNKNQTDKFVRLMTYVNKTRLINNSENKDKDVLNQNKTKVNDYADKYVEKYIKPEKKQYIRANIQDWINSEITDSRKKRSTEKDVEEARLKFEEDFKKYNYTSNPTMLLDEFLLASASDSKTTKNNNFYKSLVENELEISKLIEIQDLLMEAVETGNAAQVKNHFKDYDVHIQQGYNIEETEMDSDEAIDWMVRNLLIKNNTKTAKMFVEKLGLGDRVMRIERKLIEDLNAKEKINEACEILIKTGELSTIIKEELDNLTDGLNNSDDYISAANKTKQNIIERTKDLDSKKEVTEYLKAIDEGVKFIKENPGLPKNILMEQKTTDASIQIANETNKILTEKQDYFHMVNNLYKFLLDIHLPEYSKGAKLQKVMAKEQKALENYYINIFAKAYEKAGNIMMTKEE